MSNLYLACLGINSLPPSPPQSILSLPGMKTSAVLLLCLAWARALHHHPVEDSDLHHQVKERIERDTVNIEVGETKAKLQELGEDILDEEKYTVEVANKIVRFVLPLLGLETEVGEHILKEMEHNANDLKEDLEDINDGLPTTVNPLVEGLSILTQSEMETKLAELRQVTKRESNLLLDEKSKSYRLKG